MVLQGEGKDAKPLNKPYIPLRTGHIPDPETLKGDMFEAAVDNVLAMFKDERILAAAAYLDYIEAGIRKGSSGAKKAAAKLATPEVAEKIALLREREEVCYAALRDFNSTDGGWEFGHEMLGIKTFFKEGENDTVWLKLEGMVQNVDLMDCCSVVRETDLFRTWVPFCNKSALLKEEGPAELVTYLNLNVPLTLQRDAVLHAFTCDASYEQNCIMVLGKSIDEYPGVEFPKTLGGRMFFNGFRALVEPVNREQMRICVVTNIDMRLKLPKTLLNFVIKKVAGVLIYLLTEKTKEVKKPDNVYMKVRNEDKSGFYRWAEPVFKEFFQTLESNRLPAKFSVPAPSEKALAEKKALSIKKKPKESPGVTYSGSIFWALLAVLLYMGLQYVESPSKMMEVGVLCAVWLSGFAFSQANVKHFVAVEKLIE